MAYLLILIFIPIFFVGVVMYVSTLYGYAFNSELDVVILLIGLFTSIISSFVLLKTVALMEYKNHIMIKLQKRVDAIISLFSFTLLFIFGVALIINTLNNTINIGKMIVGIGIIVFYGYIIYYTLFTRVTKEFRLKEITKVNDKLNLLTFENKEYGNKEIFIKSQFKYKKGSLYKCLYSTVFNDITKIKEEVK